MICNSGQHTWSRTRHHGWAVLVLGAMLAMMATALAQEGASSAPVAAATAATSSVPPPETAPASGTVQPSASQAATPSAALLLPQDLSPWQMFLQADVVVKAVMIGLSLASLVTWTIWLAKGLELAGARRNARGAMQALQQAPDLATAAGEITQGRARTGPIAALVDAAVREAERSAGLSADGIKERLAIALSRIEARAGRDMSRGTGLLATIGATAPFVGLFGTVWGIMNAFIGISQARTTNLAVVAPGIAEALLATATGLVAAIPAVVIYNIFARSIAGYRALLSDASGEVLQHVSRDLERQDVQAAAAPARTGGRVRPAS